MVVFSQGGSRLERYGLVELGRSRRSVFLKRRGGFVLWVIDWRVEANNWRESDDVDACQQSNVKALWC